MRNRVWSKLLCIGFFLCRLVSQFNDLREPAVSEHKSIRLENLSAHAIAFQLQLLFIHPLNCQEIFQLISVAASGIQSAQ